MPIVIYNTLSSAKEEFRPVAPGRVGMYVCGPTVYDSCHIGHARAAVVFDVVYRYLKHKGFEVTYVRNYTDVDDKVIKRANDEGRDFREVADYYIDEYDRDMESLKVLAPDVRPRVTENIDEIVRTVQTLVEKGFAYEVGGDVFFDVGSFPDYGKLSKRDTDSMLAGARVDINEQKRNELDFALWKRAKPGEPCWDSPWGKGRPGWHIECSVMSAKHLGLPFDIHGGGIDLVFPHHENEIAQAEAATGVKPFAKYWIHNGHVTTRGEKISKSLGNFIPIRQLVEKWHPEALRLFLLSKHYSSPVDFTEEGVDEAQDHIDRYYKALAEADKLAAAGGKKNSPLPEAGELVKSRLEAYSERFEAAMDADFNTAGAVAVLMEMRRDLNRFLDRAKPSVRSHTELAAEAAEKLRSMGAALGILDENPVEYLESVKRKRIARHGIDERYIEGKIAERAQARREKDFDRADEIREELKRRGIEVKDTPEGTEWEVKSQGGDPPEAGGPGAGHVA